MTLLFLLLLITAGQVRASSAIWTGDSWMGADGLTRCEYMVGAGTVWVTVRGLCPMSIWVR